MAGLPKVLSALLVSITLIVSIALVAVADEVQTNSIVVPPDDVQTATNVLQPVFDLIAANLYADPVDQESLRTDFESAINLGVLTPEQAVAMLELVEWETLVEPAALSNVAAAIETILAGFIAGEFTAEDSPVIELTRLLNELATPAGTLTAIGKAGADQEILDQVSSLAASGIPPGILVQITKEGLRDGLSTDEIMAQLDALATAVADADEEISWGRLVHDITEEGEYQDQEQNENIDGNEEPEQEENAHEDGSSSGNEENNGKKDAPPGQEGKKDKGK